MIDFAFPTSRHVAQAAVRLTWRCLPILMPLGLLLLPGVMLTGLEPAYHLQWMQSLLAARLPDAVAAAGEPTALQTAVGALGMPVATFVAGAADVLGSAVATVLLSGWLTGAPLGLLQAIGSLRGRGTEIGMAAVCVGSVRSAAQLLLTGAYAVALTRQTLPAEAWSGLMLMAILLVQAWVCCNFSVVGPLAAKGVDGWPALGASMGLSRGKRWRILGAWLWTALFAAVPVALLAGVVALAGQVWPAILSVVVVLALLMAPVRFILPALLLFDVRVAAASQNPSQPLQKAA